MSRFGAEFENGYRHYSDKGGHRLRGVQHKANKKFAEKNSGQFPPKGVVWLTAEKQTNSQNPTSKGISI